jgi:hypothetical protein
MMASVTWPASLLLSVLVVCTTVLSLKGLVPVHVFFTVGGLLLGYLIPKSSGLLGRKQQEGAEGDRDTFSRDETPTRKTVPDVREAKKDEAKKNE